MKENFDDCLTEILLHEGSFVNHPKDPGGATNMGITIGTLQDWRDRTVTVDDVKKLTRTEAADIYRWRYWNEIRGNELPAGVDLAVFDFAVNSGPARAVKFLQRVIGTLEDGKIGPVTLNQVKRADPLFIVNELCRARLAWLKTLGTWSTFGRGWTKRVHSVEDEAEYMVMQSEKWGGSPVASFPASAQQMPVQPIPYPPAPLPPPPPQQSPWAALLAAITELFSRKAA